MEKITTSLVTSLIALTAIVTLAKSIVEYRTAKMKLAKESSTPAVVRTTSIRSQRTLSRSQFWLGVCIIAFSLGAIIWMAYGPLASQPAQVRHVAGIGVCVLNILQVNRWYEG